jgi:hypothetical protein
LFTLNISANSVRFKPACPQQRSTALSDVLMPKYQSPDKLHWIWLAWLQPYDQREGKYLQEHISPHR